MTKALLDILQTALVAFGTIGIVFWLWRLETRLSLRGSRKMAIAFAAIAASLACIYVLRARGAGELIVEVRQPSLEALRRRFHRPDPILRTSIAELRSTAKGLLPQAKTIEDSAYVAIGLSDFNSARRFAEQSLSRNLACADMPKVGESYYLLGVLDFIQSDNEAAMQNFFASVHADPLNVASVGFLISSETSQGNFDRSQQLLDSLVRQMDSPSVSEEERRFLAFYGRGVCLLMGGFQASARDNLDSALIMRPGDASVKMYLGLIDNVEQPDTL